MPNVTTNGWAGLHAASVPLNAPIAATTPMPTRYDPTLLPLDAEVIGFVSKFRGAPNQVVAEGLIPR